MPIAELLELLPCLEKVHKRCYEAISRDTAPECMTCPWCGQLVSSTREFVRRQYAKYSIEDRRLVIEAALRGECYEQVAASLGIKRSTADGWVNSGALEPAKKGGKSKILSREHLDSVISWLEKDTGLTMVQLRDRCAEEFRLNLSPCTVSRALHGLAFNAGRARSEARTINLPVSRRKRKRYVEGLQEHLDNGRHIIYLDETNFNLFRRATSGRLRRVPRMVCRSRNYAAGGNIHLTAAISTSGLEKMDVRRETIGMGLDEANAWLKQLIGLVGDCGVAVSEVVVVCSNAPSYSRYEEVAQDMGFSVHRLDVYSPMLNPVEGVWRVMKEQVGLFNREAFVDGPGAAEERMDSLERLMRDSIDLVTTSLCASAINKAMTFFGRALAEKNMKECGMAE